MGVGHLWLLIMRCWFCLLAKADCWLSYTKNPSIGAMPSNQLRRIDSSSIAQTTSDTITQTKALFCQHIACDSDTPEEVILWKIRQTQRNHFQVTTHFYVYVSVYKFCHILENSILPIFSPFFAKIFIPFHLFLSPPNSFVIFCGFTLFLSNFLYFAFVYLDLTCIS